MNRLPDQLPDVLGRIEEAIAKEIRIVQPVSNWASRLGHPCKRYLVYSRKDWDKIPPISVEKKMIFDLGNVFERHVAKTYLEKAGFEVVEMDRPIQSEASGMLQKHKIHGRLDFICRDVQTGFEFPVEAKSINPTSFDQINSIEDMLFAKHFWTRQYPGQLMMYLLGKNAEVGLFLLINKVTGKPKPIWLHQDYTYAEELIQKAESVNKHCDEGTYPDRINYDESVCGRCDFASICLPDTMRNEADVLADPQLLDELEEREMLKEPRRRFEELDDAVKGKLKNIPKGICGDFLIIGKEMTRKNYARGPETDATVYWKSDIKRVGGGK